MIKKFEKYLSEFELNQPCTQKSINDLEKNEKISLPSEYQEFMLCSDGGEGSIGDSYLSLWKIGDIVELNEDYGVDEFAPGLLIIGSDGGDTAYCIDTNSEKLPFVEVPFIGMDLNEVQLCGNTFIDFLEYLYTKEE